MTALDRALEHGLPRAANTRPRDSLNMLMFSPIEQITSALYRGDEFSPQAIHDLETLCRRVDALRKALDARLDVLED